MSWPDGFPCSPTPWRWGVSICRAAERITMEVMPAGIAVADAEDQHLLHQLGPGGRALAFREERGLEVRRS